MADAGLSDWRWSWDEALFHAVNGLGLGWLDSVFVAASSHEFGAVALVGLLLALVARLRRAALLPVLQAVLALAVSDGVGARLLKPAFARLRPSYALGEAARVLSPAANVGSLPSLHAANAFAIATVVVLAWPRAGLVAVPVALLIAVSRVGVGVHWPSDVMAGGLYGAAVGVGVVLASRALVSRRAPPAPSTPRRDP